MTESGFIHLHVHSAYSLAEGAIPVKDLIKKCVAGGMPAVAVTDTNNLFGAMEFATEAAKAGVQPIIGVQLTVGANGEQIVLLVQSEAGYRNLSKLVSESYMKAGENRAFEVTPERIAQYNEGLICLTGGLAGEVAQALLHHRAHEAEAALLHLKGIFRDRLYIELQRHGWPDEDAVEDALIELAYKHEIPLVATNDCYFGERDAYEAHDALLCIAEGRYISEANRRKVTPEHSFKSSREMKKLFADLPEAVANTQVIARRCSFLLKPAKPVLPAFPSEAGRTEGVQSIEEQGVALDRLEPADGQEAKGTDEPGMFDRAEPVEVDAAVDDPEAIPRGRIGPGHDLGAAEVRDATDEARTGRLRAEGQAVDVEELSRAVDREAVREGRVDAAGEEGHHRAVVRHVDMDVGDPAMRELDDQPCGLGEVGEVEGSRSEPGRAESLSRVKTAQASDGKSGEGAAQAEEESGGGVEQVGRAVSFVSMGLAEQIGRRREADRESLDLDACAAHGLDFSLDERVRDLRVMRVEIGDARRHRKAPRRSESSARRDRMESPSKREGFISRRESRKGSMPDRLRPGSVVAA